MKKLSLVTCFLLLFFAAGAQHKIITVKLDTIHCTILSVSSTGILYELKNIDGSVTGKQIPVSEVLEYSRSDVPAEAMQPVRTQFVNPAYLPDKP